MPRRPHKKPKLAVEKAVKIPREATADDIAQLLALSTRRIGQIASEASIEPVSRGRYAVAPIIQAAFAIARRERGNSSERDERARTLVSRRREIELRTAREEHQLVPIDEAVAYAQLVIGTMMSRIDGLPAQFTRDLEERRRLEAAIDGIRGEVAAAIADHGPAYRGLPDNPDDEE